MTMDVSFHFFVRDYLENLVGTNACVKSNCEYVQDSVVRVIDEISKNFKLFLGHQTRC